MRTPLQVALSYLGAKETSRNQGPEIAKFWPDTNYPEGFKNREPWCAAFVCHCLAQAEREGWQHVVKKLPRDASVKYFLAWAEGRPGVDLFRPVDRPLLPGDIVIYLPKLSHIGILEVPAPRALTVVEGNTDDKGGREGTEVCRRARALSLAGWIVRFQTPGL